MPRTKKQFENIRTEKIKLIKEVAMKLFANEGYHSTSVSKIAKQANISKGLLYNYFKGKEELLKDIFYDIAEEVMSQVIPNNETGLIDDDEECFIDRMFDVVIDNPQDWKLFFQLSMQQDVMDVMMNENMSDKFIHYQNFMFRYFVDREFDDLHLSILHFASVYRGFAMSYVFAPELFDQEGLNRFKMLLKGLFVKPKRKEPLKDVQIDEFMGYLLM